MNTITTPTRRIVTDHRFFGWGTTDVGCLVDEGLGASGTLRVGIAVGLAVTSTVGRSGFVGRGLGCSVGVDECGGGVGAVVVGGGAIGTVRRLGAAG
jgi:hypothetical protein